MKTQSRTFRLPTFPAVAVRLLDVFSDPDVSIRDVAKVLESDPALAAKILKAANSATFGCGRGIADIGRALTLLGKRTVTSLALGFSLSDVATKRGDQKQLFQDYWLQAVVRATTCEHLGRRYSRGKEGELFAAGLLSSLGWLALLHSEPAKFDEIRKKADVEDLNPLELEQEAFGTDYIQLTSQLLGQWNLPAELISAARDQAAELTVLEGTDPSEITIFDKAVSVAAAMGSFLCQGKRAISLIRIHELMGMFFGASQDDVDQLIAQVRERLSASAEMFQAEAGHLPSPSEILSQAMEQLSELAASALRDGNTPNSQDVLEENGRLRRRVEELTRRSTIDPLTHIFNRGYLTERLAEQVAVARLRQQKVGLIFIDVDHFKSVNDTYGHAAGDRVLERVARAIESVIRTSDVLGRYGGEEFIVLTGSGDITGLGCVGERIRARIAEEAIEYDGRPIVVTASIGGALMGPPIEGDDTQQRLIDSADAAMYMAKRNGRNQVVLMHENEQGQQETVMAQD